MFSIYGAMSAASSGAIALAASAAVSSASRVAITLLPVIPSAGSAASCSGFRLGHIMVRQSAQPSSGGGTTKSALASLSWPFSRSLARSVLAVATTRPRSSGTATEPSRDSRTGISRCCTARPSASVQSRVSVPEEAAVSGRSAR